MVTSCCAHPNARTEDPSPSHPLCFSCVGGIRSLRHLVPSRLPCRVTSTSSTVMRTTVILSRPWALRSLPIASPKCTFQYASCIAWLSRLVGREWASLPLVVVMPGGKSSKKKAKDRGSVSRDVGTGASYPSMTVQYYMPGPDGKRRILAKSRSAGQTTTGHG